MPTNDTVTVPFVYFLQLHSQVNAVYEILEETYGAERALAIFTSAADRVLPSKEATSEASVEKLHEILCGGYELTETHKDNVVEFSLTCPFADEIHPRLNTGASLCPMSQTVLSTIRKKYANSEILESKLVKGGSRFVIRLE